MIAIALLVLGVAALSYWLGTKSWSIFPPREASVPDEANAPIPLPEATIPAEPGDIAEPVSESEPLPAAPVARPAERPRPSSPQERGATKADAKPAEDQAEQPAKLESSGLRDPWPVRAVEGASGRLVHVGTFATRRQAKRGWNALMRVNPSLQRLPAMVMPARSRRDDKVYYRLQMGTTSQAHSVALCQRLRMIGQSCIVLGDAVEKKAE